MKQFYIYLLWLLFCVPIQAAFAQEIGKIEGVVVDSETNQPLSEVKVTLKEVLQKVKTDAEGKFSFEAVYGTYTLTVASPFYNSQVVSAVQLTVARPTRTLRISLTPQIIQLEGIEVTVRPSTSSEAGLLNKRRRSFVVEDSISTELMSKLPVSDAGDALKRVTGISIVGGRYVYVRGLGERYSNTLLNNLQIPSPEPNRRVVPMDIFPTNLLKSLQTVKTFSPDQPGNFAGGSVQVFTKDFPESLIMSVSMSTSVNTQTTGTEGLSYLGGGRDFIGFDDGTRSLPALIASKAESTPIRERGIFTKRGFNQDDIQNFGRAFNNVWSPQQVTMPANQGYKFSVGNTGTLGGKQIGYLGVISYSNGHSHRTEERNSFRLGLNNALSPVTAYQTERSANEIKWGGVLNTSLQLSPAHQLSMKTLFSHDAEDQTRTWEGFNADRNTDMRSSRLLYVTRGLFSGQLAGDHEFGEKISKLEENGDIRPASTLNWRLMFSRAMRNEPDTREVVYEERDGKWLFRDITQSGSRFFFDLEDDEIGGRVDWSIAFGSEGTFKVGGMWRMRDRTFDARRFRFEPADNIGDFVDLSSPPETLFAPENLSPRVFELRESTRATDNYLATHDVLAGYGMVDTPLTQKLRLTTGIRLEDSDQRVTTYDPFAAEVIPIVAALQTTDVLPSVNLTYLLTDDMNLRLAVSRTLTRPDLREMAPFEFTDFVGGRTEFGNPDLERSLIDNYDIRWEAFPELGGVMAVSAFYKRFRKPIEQIVQPQAEVRITYENAIGARNYGVELEFRRNLRQLHSYLRDFSVNSNIAFIRSQVELPENVGIQTLSERPLQGQSPYVVNATLGYDNPDLEVSGAISYHVFGKRIAEVGSHGSPDVYELSRSQLDVSLSRTIVSYYRLSFSAKNLLDPDVVFKQGDATYIRYRMGRTFSFGVSYSL